MCNIAVSPYYKAVKIAIEIMLSLSSLLRIPHILGFVQLMYMAVALQL